MDVILFRIRNIDVQITGMPEVLELVSVTNEIQLRTSQGGHNSFLFFSNMTPTIDFISQLPL